jgi:hypothetical protein
MRSPLNRGGLSRERERERERGKKREREQEQGRDKAGEVESKRDGLVVLLTCSDVYKKLFPISQSFE